MRPKPLVKQMHQKGIKTQSQGVRLHTSRHDVHTKTCAKGLVSTFKGSGTSASC
jgi:hypothetical protein